NTKPSDVALFKSLEQAISGSLTLSSFSSLFSHSPSSPNHHHDHHHRPPIRQPYPRCLRPPRHHRSSPRLLQLSEESDESEMSSGDEEIELNFDFNGVRSGLALRITAPNQLRTEDIVAVYYGRMTEILVRRASFPDEFTRLTAIMWINEIVLKHAYYKDQACMSQATYSAMATLVNVQPLFWLELEDR
ncbi:hypothetical protein IGI04_034814, partial [Brassica rapa subsp. trilocularis]